MSKEQWTWRWAKCGLYVEILYKAHINPRHKRNQVLAIALHNIILNIWRLQRWFSSSYTPSSIITTTSQYRGLYLPHPEDHNWDSCHDTHAETQLQHEVRLIIYLHLNFGPDTTCPRYIHNSSLGSLSHPLLLLLRRFGCRCLCSLPLNKPLCIVAMEWSNDPIHLTCY